MLDNLTNQDLFILGFLLVLIFIVGCVCLFMLFFRKKEEKTEIVEKEPDIKVSLATNNIPEISEEAPKLDEILKVEQDEAIEEPVVIAEVDNVTLETEKKQEEQTKSSIEEVLKAMNADLEKQKYENIDRYEEEQEENAVISYQELLDRKMALNNEREQKEVKEVESEKTENSTLTEDTAYKRETKFSNSEFISPIFGRVNNNTEYPKVKKETKEEQEVDDFLSSLKEFRNNL